MCRKLLLLLFRKKRKYNKSITKRDLSNDYFFLKMKICSISDRKSQHLLFVSFNFLQKGHLDKRKMAFQRKKENNVICLAEKSISIRREIFSRHAIISLFLSFLGKDKKNFSIQRFELKMFFAPPSFAIPITRAFSTVNNLTLIFYVNKELSKNFVVLFR